MQYAQDGPLIFHQIATFRDQYVDTVQKNQLIGSIKREVSID